MSFGSDDGIRPEDLSNHQKALDLRKQLHEDKNKKEGGVFTSILNFFKRSDEPTPNLEKDE